MFDNKKSSVDKLIEKNGPSLAGGIMNMNSQMKKDPNEEYFILYFFSFI